MTNNNLTTGNIRNTLLKFALPYMLAAFMQTFYGMADLMIVGLFNNASTITAVSIGSQIMHMITVVILGFTMGTTVQIGKCVGEKNKAEAEAFVLNSILFFIIISIPITILLLISTPGIANIMLTPAEAIIETSSYLKICFLGIPFITAYNVICSIFRGSGNSKSPMIFVAISFISNIVFDFLFIGYLNLGATGAALGTVLSQIIGVVISVYSLKKATLEFEIEIKYEALNKNSISKLLSVGFPIALQDGLIQIAFIIITIIANSRGLISAASVGIVEKIICFMFLIPSSYLSANSAITAQNIGANKPERAKKSLYYSIFITSVWGLICTIYCQLLPHTLISLFTGDTAVISSGCEYLRSYSFDTFFAAFHFCFSGYFCGIEKSKLSFLHNIISISLVRIPGAYFFSKLYPNTLYPMGFAAPLGSFFSTIICLLFFFLLSSTGKNIQPFQSVHQNNQE